MHNRLLTLTLAATMAAAGANADKVDVKKFRYSGPFSITNPLMIDSVDVNSGKFDISSLLDTPASLSSAKKGNLISATSLPASQGNSLHLINFRVDNQRYFEGKLKVEGLKKYAVYLDGKKMNGDRLVLTPASHDITVKCLSTENGVLPVKLAIEGDHTDLISVNPEGDRLFTLQDVMTGRSYSGVSLSPSGKYLLSSYSYTHDGGRTTLSSKVTDYATGRLIASYTFPTRWMPKSDRLCVVKTVDNRRQLVETDPATGAETLLADDIPASYFTLSPNADFMLYRKNNEGPKEKNKDLYEIINPEDRQPGWRDRGQVMKYDFATGISTPVTFGNRDTYISGISADGTKALVAVSETDVTQRPSSLRSLYLVDLATNKSTPVFEKEGFIGGCVLSPNGTKVAVQASPEAFNGIGKNLPEGKTPSMYDYQMYLIDIPTKKITPLTRDFNPCVEEIKWSANDGMIYFTADDRDLKSLFRVNPATGRIENLNAKEDYVKGFALADNSPAIVYFGQGATNADRIYALDSKKLKHRLVEDLSAERLAGIKLGKFVPWAFQSSRGDSITGRYVLPPDFDPAKKYPMIVNYYGGCTPTGRTFESRYPHQVYAANGYVVLLLNPSGAAGFGQEFASRHVNTAGEGVAEDIIEAVKKFCSENPWVDASKIGCIGASYGGFMTQYLQTRTDIFAAAISHAGISDHTSYWGEGYWGYSYSEVSMANSYPWSHPDLYVKQSPLYNADKIHTPILFLHGDGDTNVPFGESIQMYTALKRLGRPTAFVAVRGANHQVTEFEKRKQWQETIFAWFAKHLQGDSSWWERLYPSKPLN